MLSQEELTSMISVLKYENAADLCSYQLDCELRQKIGPSFRHAITKAYELIETNNDESPKQAADIFVKAIDELYKEMEKYWRWLGNSNDNGKFRSKTILMTKTALFHTMAPELRRVIRFVYEKTFSAFYQAQNRGKVPLTSPQDGTCNVCEKPKTKCECWYLVTQFRACNERLLDLELLDRLAGSTVIEIARSTIEKRIQKVCNPGFTEEHLETLKEWLEKSLFKWLEEVYVFSSHSTKSSYANRRSSTPASEMTKDHQSTKSDDRRAQFEHQTVRLKYFLHESYGYYLIEKLFNIIVDYPDSKPALVDLKRCMTWVSLRSRLTDCLKTSLESRLLHPGVNTADILSAYIQTVYSLRMLDASGILMENVCQPVKQYLRQRTDTVRCIVSHLTDNGGLEMSSGAMGDLSLLSFNESGTETAGTGNVDAVAVSDNVKEDEDWIEWQPDPVDAPPELIGRSKRSADVISMLVGVYGSREQFVKEYCQLLSERLVRANTYNIDDEIKYLELLKLRIGESELNQCEVMLKDVRDSQRIDSFVRSQPSMKDITVPVSALIISSYFWPTLKEERLQLPQSVDSVMECYSKCFEMQKASRTLDWKTNLGVVELELELSGRLVSFCVTPILASIIMLFQKKDSWTAEALAQELKITVPILKRRISWWTGTEVIRESTSGIYRLCTELPISSLSKHRRLSYGLEEDDDDDMEGGAGDLVDKVEQLETYWPYILGLLTSFDELTAERIHTLLRMFCSQGQEPALETVHGFLQRKVRDQHLTYIGGAYKLQKK